MLLLRLLAAHLYDLAARSTTTTRTLYGKAAWRIRRRGGLRVSRDRLTQYAMAAAVVAVLAGLAGGGMVLTGPPAASGLADSLAAPSQVAPSHTAPAVDAGAMAAVQGIHDQAGDPGAIHAKAAASYERMIVLRRAARARARARAAAAAAAAAAAKAAAAAAAKAATATPVGTTTPSSNSTPPPVGSSGGWPTVLSYSQLEQIWVAAGGPAAVEATAATIATCESGGNSKAQNPSGAAGLWQILGLPFPGDPFDPFTNARMAVAKYQGAGDSFSPWVCQG